MLSNAFKYTSLGGTVSLSVQEYENSVVILISDTGIGIAEKSLDKIFDRFYQVDSTDNQKGTGIGLALAKSIIEAHKGKISVRSMEGKGTTFVVELPLGDSHIADSQKVATPDIDSSCISELTMYGDKALTDVMDDENPANELEDTKSKILIVEDNEELRGLLVRLFSKVYSVCEAQDGEEGLDKTKEIQPDIVLSDIMMPKMDGWQVCREIRESSKVPIIMLTARSEERDELQGFDLGVDEYISKPFSPKILVARVEAILRRTGKSAQENEVLDVGGIHLDKAAHMVEIDGRSVDLSYKEFELLTYFMENRGIALSREKILNNVWNYDYFGDARTIDTHVKKLRSKLGEEGNLIKTIWGMGYKMDETAE